MIVVIYRLSDGRVMSRMSGQEQDIQMDIPEGCSYLEIQSVTSTEALKYKRVVNGTLEDIPFEEKEAEVLAVEWKRFRKSRKTLLNQSDWTQVPDDPVDSAAWAVYRQQLRDLPANTTDPRNVVWPEPPS